MKKKGKGGRPSIYTDNLALEICFRLAKGESVLKICRDEDMPNADTIYTWLLDGEHKEFSENYARARNVQAEHLFDEILEIADEALPESKAGDPKRAGAKVQAQHVRIDARKWYLSKVLPKKFGDKIDLTSGGEPIKGNAIIFEGYGDKTESK